MPAPANLTGNLGPLEPIGPLPYKFVTGSGDSAQEIALQQAFNNGYVATFMVFDNSTQQVIVLMRLGEQGL